MNNSKRLIGSVDGRKDIALATLLVMVFAIAAFADSVLLSIDYTNPNATIIGISESSTYAFVNQSGSNWTIWYNNASFGSFTVTANAQDNISGIVNMTWPNTVSAGGMNYTTNISSINFTWLYNWSQFNTTNHTDRFVTVYDNASNNNTSWNFFNVLIDNIAPTTTDDGPTDNATWSNETSVVVNLTAVDADSGVNFTAWCIHNASDAACTPDTINYTNPTPINLTCADNCYYFIRYFSGDNVNNNESETSSNKINFAVGSVVEDGVAADENTTIESGSTIYNSGTNLTNATIAGNSTIDNSTITDSVVNESDVNSSIVDNSTVENGSNITDSNVSDSTVDNSSVTNSTADNTTLTNSTLDNSTALDTIKIRSIDINSIINTTTETDTNATDSNLTGANFTLCSLLRSTATNMNGTTCTLTDTIAANSNLTNFVADNCTIDNTVVSNSNCTDSTFNYTTGNGWNVDPSNVTGSYCAGGCNVSNSNVTWSNISLSSFYNANFNNSNINLSSANYSSAYDSNFYNSTLVNISVSDSAINDSSLYSSGPSVISTSTIRLVTLSSNYTIINSTLTNVTLYGTGTIADSTISDSVLNDTSAYNSTITGMTSINTTINNSQITNPTFNLTDSIISYANIQNGMLVYGMVVYRGTTYYGSRTLASIYAPAGPAVSNVQCANTTGVFGACSDIGYGETLWKVRATATQGDWDISNVVFKLENLDDSKTLFYGNWVERNGTEYRFYWNQPVLDSGTFNLTVTATDTQSATATDYANWSIPFGSLNAVTLPNSDVNVTKNSVFAFNATYDCTAGECGDINASLSFNGTLFSASPSITLTKSNYACLGGMDGGESCTVSWSVTATGNKTQLSEFVAQGLPVNYSANVSAVNSTPLNITIVNSAPTVPSIVSPVSGSSVGSTTITFDWSDSTDVDGDSFNYTFQIANNSGYSPLLNETNVTDSNFTYIVPSAGTWYWRVQAYDAENSSAWTTAFVIVSIGGDGNVTDTTPPLVVLNSPANNAYVQSGTVTFIYTPSEQLSGIANCSLYINGALNQTNSTPVLNNGENNFTVAFAGEASYNWTVECTDTSLFGPNSGNATPRVLNVDVGSPLISGFLVTYPSGQAEVKSGQSIIADVAVSDTGSGVSSVTLNCTSLGSGLVSATLQSGSSASGTWRAACLVSGPAAFEGGVNISATATDAVGYSSTNLTPVAVDNLMPDNPTYLNVTGYPADTDGVVNLTWPASAAADVASYGIYRSNVGGFAPVPGLLIASTNLTTFVDVPPSDGTWYWRVTAVDNLGQENLTGSPQNSTLVDTGAPAISNLALAYPPLAIDPSVIQTHVKNGDWLFITVDATDPQNVSDVWVDVSAINTSLGNVSMTPLGNGTYTYNATIGGTAGDADQIIRIYANDTSGNVRNGVVTTVAVDNTAPTLLALQDDGNFTATTTSIHASWNYADADSSALGYRYTIYNNLGEIIVNYTWTTSTDISKAASPPLSEGLTYFWAVDAYDGAGNALGNTTAPEGITVDTTPPVFLFVNDDGTNQSNTTALNATWSAQDLESSVRRYLYRIGEDSNFDGIIDAYFIYNVTSGVWKKGISGNNTSAWADAGTNTSITAAIDTMNAYKYYIEVKAENWAGVAALSRSDGIFITGISGCLAINAAGTYTLNGNLNSAGTCIAINANSVTLDCQGYSITGDGTTTGSGINGTTVNNITVKNCVVGNYSASASGGIWFSYLTNSTITNNNVTANLVGIRLLFSTGNTISSNNASSNTRGIVILNTSNYNIIANNTVSSNTRGIVILNTSNYNIIANNTASSNSDSGIRLDFADYNNITGNTANNNSYGIDLKSGSDYNRLVGNTLNSNAQIGVLIYSSSHNNELANNNATGNTQWDFYSESNSLNNIVTNLTTQQNLVSFTSVAVALKGLTTAQAPADPANYKNITKYVNATNNSADSWLYLNVSYTDAELVAANISESTLRIWKYNATLGNWTHETFYAAGQWGVNAAANYVFANITNFASIFAPFGSPNTAPSQVVLYAPANGTSTTVTAPTFEWYNSTDAEGDAVTYQLQVDDDSNFGSPAVNVTGVAEASPRTSYSLTTALAIGTYYWRVRAYDGAEYGNWSDTRNFAVTSPPPSGGGGPTVAAESQIIPSIAAGACGYAMYVRFGEHGMQTIVVCVNHNVANATIQITLRGATSTPVPNYPYKYINIEKTGLLDEYIDNATFTFALPRSWFAQNSIDYRSVGLYRWKDSDWHELETIWLSSDENYHYYSAFAAGLSVFAISGLQAACPPACPEPGLWSTCMNGQTSRTEYSCSVDTGFSCEPMTVTKPCAPELLCPTCPEPSEWRACVDGVQTRTEYYCSDETGYQCTAAPVARACEVPAACPVCPEPSLWSDCTDGMQSRSAYRCGPETNYACVRVDETRSCLPAEALLMTAAAIVLILGLGTVVTVRRRAMAKWWRKVGKARVTVPKITMPKAKLRRPEKIIKAARPAALPMLPTIKPKMLRMPGKPKYVCHECGKPELLVHWCEECGKETCIEHIHKIGTKLICDSCMKKKGLM